MALFFESEVPGFLRRHALFAVDFEVVTMEPEFSDVRVGLVGR